MPSNVSDVLTVADLGNGGLIKPQYASEIIKDTPKSSVILTRARRVRMGSRERVQPVLDSKPLAYWVAGDTGLKQTTKQAWSHEKMTAEELAVIVPIPENIIADSEINLWAEIRPYIAEAIGKKVDEAAIFGTDKPASWPEAIVPKAKAIGNVAAQGTGTDLAADVTALAEKMAKQGFNVNGFASQPGLNWQLMGLRDSSGRPVYTPDLQTPGAGSLYGYPLNEVNNGAWDASKAVLLMADWGNFVCGVRQDVSYKMLDQAVITDDDGKVVLNLAQQDCVAMRVTFRVAFQVTNPINNLQSDKAKRYPAGVITPAA